MWWYFAQLLVFTGLIIAVARWLLYDPAKRITDTLGVGHRAAGQMLGYLTSVPELVTAVAIAATGLMATVGYNVLTSNVINVVLAFAAALWFRQLRAFGFRLRWQQWLVVAATIVAPVGLLVSGLVSSGWMLVPLLVSYAFYLWWVRRDGRNAADEPVDADTASLVTSGRTRSRALLFNGALIAVALVMLYFLGDAVGAAVFTLGSQFAVPELVLGAVIGVATSLPELTTFFSSFAWHARRMSRGGPDEVMHNVLASNVSNTLVVTSAALLVFILV